MLKHYEHNPTYLFLDNHIYFITAAIYQQKNLLKNDDIKEDLLENIKDYCNRIQWQFDHWVILNNHYHFSVKHKTGKFT